MKENQVYEKIEFTVADDFKQMPETDHIALFNVSWTGMDWTSNLPDSRL